MRRGNLMENLKRKMWKILENLVPEEFVIALEIQAFGFGIVLVRYNMAGSVVGTYICMIILIEQNYEGASSNNEARV